MSVITQANVTLSDRLGIPKAPLQNVVLEGGMFSSHAEQSSQVFCIHHITTFCMAPKK